MGTAPESRYTSSAPAIGWTVLLSLAGLAGAGSAPAVGQDAPTGLESLGFLAGCWSQEGDGLREQFTAPSRNLILGMSRFVVDGAVVEFEFHRIELDAGTPVLTPYPAGRASVSFRASSVVGRRVTWENAAHDFPQRIIYDGSEDGVLIAAAEGERGGGGARREWRMRRVTCGQEAGGGPGGR